MYKKHQISKILDSHPQSYRSTAKCPEEIVDLDYFTMFELAKKNRFSGVLLFASTGKVSQITSEDDFVRSIKHIFRGGIELKYDFQYLYEK